MNHHNARLYMRTVWSGCGRLVICCVKSQTVLNWDPPPITIFHNCARINGQLVLIFSAKRILSSRVSAGMRMTKHTHSYMTAEIVC